MTLNRCIAEARGWQLIFDHPHYAGFCRILNPDGKEQTNPYDNHPTKWWSEKDCIRVLPDYEHDLNAAWELTADFAPNWFAKSVNWGHMGNAKLMARLICEGWLEWKGMAIEPDV